MARAGAHDVETRRGGDEATRLRALIEQVCADMGASELALCEGGRDAHLSRVRARVCRAAVHELGIRPATVARALAITRAAVTLALRRQPPRGSF